MQGTYNYYIFFSIRIDINYWIIKSVTICCCIRIITLHRIR